MKEGIVSLQGLEEKIKGVNTENISRDLEILKTKTKWLENQVEGLNIKPIHDRIVELESELKKVSGSSPIVME